MSHTETTAKQENPGKLLRYYITGFILCILLTVLAYSLDSMHLMPAQDAYTLLVVLLVAEVIVQAVCFLRLNTGTESGRWNLLCFAFTAFIIAIVVIGSLWIMYNLNYYMVH